MSPYPRHTALAWGGGAGGDGEEEEEEDLRGPHWEVPEDHQVDHYCL